MNWKYLIETGFGVIVGSAFFAALYAAGEMLLPMLR